MPQPLPKSPNYQAEMSALLRMHQLSLAGKEESEEADLVRESAYDHWENLSKVEKDRLTGLSKDLYEISDGPAQPPAPMSPEAQAKLAQADEARERGEWDRALELLRHWGKHMRLAMVSYSRGRIWQDAGEPATAAVFFEHASRLEPENENYQAAFRHTLEEANPVEAASREDTVLQATGTKSPRP